VVTLQSKREVAGHHRRLNLRQQIWRGLIAWQIFYYLQDKGTKKIGF